MLGEHVEQRGSLVRPEGLRFDFSHGSRLSDEERQEIERLVNEKIRANWPCKEERDVPLEEAKQRGARALFGEKYGDKVRVITFGGDYSVELCGGTHVRATGEIGLFKIERERALAAGIRRIEASTGDAAFAQFQQAQRSLDALSALLKHPKDIEDVLKKHLQQENDLQQRLSALEQSALADTIAYLGGRVVERKQGLRVLVAHVRVPKAQLLRDICFSLAEKHEGLLVVLTTEVESRPQLAVYLDRSLVKTHAWRADALCNRLASQHIGGRGGGQAFFAMAGGKESQGLEALRTEAKKALEELAAQAEASA